MPVATVVAFVNAPLQSRLQLVCDPFTGPFVQDGPLGFFNPSRDLEIYINGVLSKVKSWVFDAPNNRYLLFMDSLGTGVGVNQVVHHIPEPPFKDAASVTLGSFSIQSQLLTEGDEGLTPTAILFVSPNPITGFGENFGVNFGGQPIPPGTLIVLLWATLNVAQIEITGDNGTDPPFDTGLLETTGFGIFDIPSGFTASITMTLAAYDQNGNPIIVGGFPLTSLFDILIG